VWWRINSRLEEKNIHFFGFHFSPRTFLLTFSAFVLGVIVSAPVAGSVITNFEIGGIFALAGLMVSMKRVVMTPPELIALYRLTGYRKSPAQARGKAGQLAESPQAEQKKEVEMLPVDDFLHPRPYEVGGRLRVREPTKLYFYSDSRLLSEALVSPTSPEYRFVYVPQTSDIGTHDLVIKVEGWERPLFERTVAVVPAGKEMMLEQVK
jgi:hypothetical protein